MLAAFGGSQGRSGGETQYFAQQNIVFLLQIHPLFRHKAAEKAQLTFLGRVKKESFPCNIRVMEYPSYSI